MIHEVKKQVCFRCGKGTLITDNDVGEIICGFCGLVITERIENSGYDRIVNEDFSKSRTGSYFSLAKYDNLSTTINPSNVDAYGQSISSNMRTTVERLRNWNNRSQGTPIEKNLRIALGILNATSDKIGISENIVEEAAYIYRKALEKKLVRGRSISAMICAAIYAACRKSGIPRTMRDIVDMTNISEKSLAASYRLLIKELGLKIPPQDAKFYVARIAGYYGISEKIIREAIEIIKKAESVRVSAGKHPMALAATALYISCQNNDFNITQKEIALASKITEVTLRNRLKGIQELLSH
jgi:transcription initiation factor TFIIB